MMKLEPTAVYWEKLQHGQWTLHLAATDSGLCCITLPNETLDTLQQWVSKHVPRAEMIQERTKLHPYIEQINEYLCGSRTSFAVPLDLRGTPFQIGVWRTLLAIPFGATRNYSEIATNMGRPTAVRAVGAANGANPIPIIVPCHRVVGKDGTLTGYRGGMQMKAELLRLEAQHRV